MWLSKQGCAAQHSRTGNRTNRALLCFVFGGRVSSQQLLLLTTCRRARMSASDTLVKRTMAQRLWMGSITCAAAAAAASLDCRKHHQTPPVICYSTG